ncbi:cytochrome b [Gemmobacter caeruleus]|uniref:cytochrome b n=1 Tax=Gemmobacter caeruleus TaxID=2595004 RepID=UPI0011ECD96F|nr:cytochrome b/b6 domain-containing protein [Gemmobacter caeruleus]
MPTGYSRSQIVLHWLTALVILWQFVANDAMGAAWRAVRQGNTPAFDPLVLAHVAGGVIVLAFALWRLVLRKTRGAPPPPADEAPALKLAAAATHIGLYLVMILLTVSGGMAWFGGVTSAGEVHEVLTTLLLVLIGLHVVAALWHQFWLRDGLMDRMRRAE